jgi:hypothetical protein
MPKARALIVALLFPGIFFFIGVATYESFSREIIRSRAVSEIALATLASVAIHIALLTLLSAFGFRLSSFIARLAEYSHIPHVELVRRVVSRLLAIAGYLIASTVCGTALGMLVGMRIVTGPLRGLVKQKWVYDLIDRDRRRATTTVYVMTMTNDDNMVVMYRGAATRVFVPEGGKLSISSSKIALIITWSTEMGDFAMEGSETFSVAQLPSAELGLSDD